MISATHRDNLALARNLHANRILVMATTFDRCLSCFISPIASARVARPGQAGEGQAMGHNKGRDNPRKRSKRRKENERLAAREAEAVKK